MHAQDPGPRPSDASQASRERLRALEKRYGRILNIHGEIAHSPLVLSAYMAVNAAIAEHGRFEAPTREAIL